MSMTELLPVLKDLSRGDKLQVMQVLLAELAQEEAADSAPFLCDAAYPIWSPHDATSAADTLLDLLQTDANP